MNPYICREASLEDICKKFDYEISKAKNDKDNWMIWKDKFLDRAKKGYTTTYIGLLNNEIICECTAAFDASVVQNAEGLIDSKTAYLFAFRTNEEYQGKGYFSKLFQYMIQSLKEKGYSKVTLGVEPEEQKNKDIYFKYGFTEHIKDSTEEYPDGTVISVEYYGKELNNDGKTS